MQTTIRNAPTVIVGMSGGVDSSVAALLLQQKGLRVQGLFMHNWEDDEEGYCSAAEDYQDARNVCERLEIPLHRVDFTREYRDRVFSYFLAEYRDGRTPNPDVLCNREIKFGVFYEHARRLGADLVATGHYARLGAVDAHGAPVLLKGRDQGKDQSYFLHAVPTAPLSNTRFPVGELEKPNVRKLAVDAGLPTARKKDSTGICFIGERPFREFLARYLPARPGAIETLAGDVIGEHHGLMYHTLGQRRGLGIGGRAGADEAPWYVIEKDLERNVLLVDQDPRHPRLLSDRITVDTLSFIAGRAPAGEFRCGLKTRYRQPDQNARVRIRADGSASVLPDEPQQAVTPGQYAVFYQGEQCLGGGIITARNNSALD